MSKAILISGCSTGIGLKTAEVLQARGYQVIASCRRENDIEKLKAGGLKHVIQLDVACSASIDSAIETTLSLCDGKLFALFNNAGFGQPGALEDVSREALRQQFETNVFGLHELTQKLIPTFLRQDDARVIQNSSILGFLGMSGRGAYCASKYALEGLTDVMRLELRNTPIKISLIEPGPILSNFRNNSLRVLKQNIDIENSRHRELYETAITRMETEGPAVPFTLPPEAVTKRVIRILESRNPKPRYYVTTPTYVLAAIKRLLPHRAFSSVVGKLEKV